MKLSEQQISTKLSEYQIEELGLSTGFHLRKVRKIDCLNFVTGFFLMLSLGKYSLNKWALHISMLIRKSVSKQAVLKKLQFRHEAFAVQVLARILRLDLQRQSGKALKSRVFAAFNEVYLEDSTCVHLPAQLADFYPGSYSHTGPCATARIQLRLNLLGETYSQLKVQSYRDNDQKHAPDIVPILQAKDLVIRDLGYWTLNSLAQIMAQQAYVLSRYRYGAYVYHAQSGQQIELHKHLRACRRKGISVWDQWVVLGKEAQLPVRIVAIKAPQAVVQQRIRKALKHRDRRANHSQAYMELLAWTILITNVEEHIWSPKQMLQAYGLRWRIEMVFKCWKSKLALAKLFKNTSSPGPAQVTIGLHLFLAWLCMFFVSYFNFFLRAVFRSCRQWLSVLKFADFFKEHFKQLLASQNLNEFTEIVAHFCTYEKRKSRINQLELLYVKN